MAYVYSTQVTDSDGNRVSSNIEETAIKRRKDEIEQRLAKIKASSPVVTAQKKEVEVATPEADNDIQQKVSASIQERIDSAKRRTETTSQYIDPLNREVNVEAVDSVAERKKREAEQAIELTSRTASDKMEEGKALIAQLEDEKGYNREKANENAVSIIRETSPKETENIWYGMDADYRTINPYDTTPKKEMTEEQREWYNLSVMAQEDKNMNTLWATQGQTLAQFRVNATTASEMLWDMYGSAGTSESVDRIYGYILDNVLAEVYNVDTSKVTKNREMYKTMAMGKNVDDRSFLSALWDSFRSDSASTLSSINAWLYEITDDEKYKENASAYNTYIQRELTDYKDRGWLGENLKAAMPIIRQGLKGYLLGMAGGALGSAIGNAIGLKTAFNSAFGLDMLRHVTTATNLGGRIGARTFSIAGTFIRESGSLLQEMDSMRDSMGLSIDKNTRILWSTVGGLINAFAEYYTPDPLMSKMKAFDFARVINRGVTSIILNFALNSVAGAVSESTEEFVQSFIGDLAKYWAKESMNEKGANFDMSEDDFSTWLDNAVSAFGEAFMPSLIVGGLGSAKNFIATFSDSLINDESARKNLKTTALRTLDTIATPENSNYTFRQEVEKYQNFPTYSKVVNEYQIDIDNTKLSKEERKAIKEQFADEDGKMPTIEVTLDTKTGLYVPASENDMKVAKYLYQEKRTKGFSVKLKDTEGLRYNTKTVSSLSGLYNGDLDVTSGTITFDNSDDMDLFLSEEFSSQNIVENSDGTVTLTLKDENDTDTAYTLKLGNVAESKRARESVKTATINDNEGNSYEIFTTQGLSEMLTTAVPSMSGTERETLVQYLKTLPSNVQNDIIQKLKTEGGDVRDFIIGVDTANEEYKNNPEILEALEKGKALSIINDARIVLKDGKTRGKDVVHEVFHVLWNIYPEYRNNLVSALKETLSDSKELNQLKEFYEENKADLDTLGNKFGDDVVGAVDSWESFLKMAETASEMNNVEQQAQDGNTAIEELYARISTVILQDPSDTAIETLPTKLKNTFKKIVEKLKSLYSDIVGKSTHAPQSLEEAVLSVFRDGNLSNLDEDGSVRFSEEVSQIDEVRKKYYGTEQWMKAPNGQPTNLDERQWLQVRTPNFKKWFGDWVLRASIKSVFDATPVAELVGDEFIKVEGESLVDRVYEYYQSLGEEVERSDIGKIILSKRGIQSSISHGVGRIKASAFKAVPEIIKNGFIVSRTENYKGRGYTSYVIDAPILIGSETYIGEVVINQDADKNRFYLHEVDVKNKFLLDNQVRTYKDNPQRNIEARTSRLILGKLWDRVNGEVSLVLDENGEPKPVKHGTPNKNFTMFNLSQTGKSDAGWLGQGFYFFGDNPTYASQYAGVDGRVIDAFLNVRNPYYISESEVVELTEKDSLEASEEFTRELKEEGYDGVFYNGDLNEEWCVFSPNQIKSATDNNGEFSTSNDDIRFSEELSLVEEELREKYSERFIESKNKGIASEDEENAIKEIVYNYPRHEVAKGVEMFDGLLNDRHDMPMQKEYLTAMLMSELLGEKLILLPRFMDRMLNPVAGYLRFNNYSLSDGVSAVAEGGKTFEFKYVSSADKVVKNLNKAMKKADVGVVIVSSPTSIEKIDVSRTLANGKGYIVNIHNENDIEVRQRNSSTKEWRFSHQAPESQHRLDNSNPMNSIAAELKKVNPADQTPMDYSVYAVRHSEELDDRKNGVVEYDGRSGYEAEDNSDRTNDTGRLQADSEGRLWVSEQYQYERGLSSSRLQRTARRFEGNELRQGAGYYVGRQTLNSRLIDLIADRFGKKADSIDFVKLDKTLTNMEYFSEKLENARTGKHGYFVDSKSVEELTSPNTDMYLSEDGKTGFVIERDYHDFKGVNNIAGVFNYSEDGIKPRYGVIPILINAIQQGGNVLDCFADGLHKMYAQIGFAPYAINPFAVEYAIGDENWERDYLSKNKDLPPVMAMYFAYNDINSFARNFKNVDIDALFENVPIANDYDEMLNERNKYVQQKKGVRFSEELDDTNKEIEDAENQMNEPDDYFYAQFIERKNKDYGNIFNPDNPNSILNRNIKSWDDLTTADIDQFIKANVYVPESVLKRETIPASAEQELEDRASINRMLSINPELRDIAENAKDEREFLQKAKQSLGIKGDGRQAELLNKYYNYSQTLSPKEFLVHFYLTYGYNTTTLEDLQRLKSLMSSRKVAKVTEDGKKITTVIANDTALAKLLVRVNKGMTEAQVHNMAKQLREGAPKYVKDLARTLVSLESETAKKYSTDFDPQMTSWLAIAMGTEQDDLFQANLRNNTASAEMEQATSDTTKSEENSRDISKMLERYEDRVTELVTEFEGKEIKRPTVEQLMRTINKLENTIESQQMSHNSWKNAYYQAIDQIRLLDNDKSALFRKLSKLVKLNHNISDDYQAKAIRLQKLLAYTKVAGNLSEVVGSALDLQKALWHEVVYRNNARASLRNMLSYNTGSYDAYYIDPTMRYLYKFIHNSDKIIEDTTANEYSVNATKRGERIDADDVTLVTYDCVDISSDDMEDTTVLYNPNSRKVDLSDMPAELERALPSDIAEGIKNGTLNFKTMTSADLNKVRSALSLVKQLSKMSQKTKEESKKMRRRERAVSVFSSQFGFDVSKLTTSERNAITESMNADPNYGKNVFEITDADIEDYIRKNPQTLFSDMADVTGETLFGKKGDIFATQFMKMQRIAERMDGQQNGPIYENFFRPLFEAYEKKKGWVYKRQQSVGDAIATILGEGDPKDKRTITRNKKMLNETKMFKNATLNDGRANIELTGWEQMGVYIYSQNIFGFIKLISSRGGNNIALEEVAKINPTDTLKFIDIALMQREQNEQVATKQTNKWWWSKTSKAEGTDYYAKDILNHVSEETLLDVKSKIQSGEISTESVLPEMVRRLGDTLIDHVSEREDEVIRAGYDEYNMLTILQERYFPLVALDDNMLQLKVEQDQKSKRVSKGMLLRRQLTDTYALKLNPLTTLYTAIQNQESMINMSQTINDMHWLMSSKGGNLKGIISQKFGSAWGRYFEEYLNMMAGAGDMDLEEMDKVMNKFIGNIAVSRIALNPLVSVKQLISLVPAMTLGELNAIEVLQGFGKLTGNKKDAWKMLIEQNSPTTFYSAYNVEAEKAQRYDDSVGSNGVLADLREKTMWLTEKLDGLTKGAIWIAKYEKEIKNGTSTKDASFRATQLVQTSQSITDDPSLAKMQRNKNPLWKIAFMFSNDAFQTWNIICGDMKNAWDQGMKTKTFKQLSGILLSNAILAFLAGGWLPDEEDEDDNTQLMDFLKDWGCETLGNIPLVGSAIQSAYQGFDTPFYQGPVQVANLFGMIGRQVEYWRTDGKSGTDYEAGDYIDRAYKVVMEGVVSPLGGPTTELERAYKALFPDGSAEGLAKSANSAWYLLGSKYGKSLYTGN